MQFGNSSVLDKLVVLPLLLSALFPHVLLLTFKTVAVMHMLGPLMVLCFLCFFGNLSYCTCLCVKAFAGLLLRPGAMLDKPGNERYSKHQDPYIGAEATGSEAVFLCLEPTLVSRRWGCTSMIEYIGA